MPFIYRGVELNTPSDKRPWGTREFEALKKIIDLALDGASQSTLKSVTTVGSSTDIVMSYETRPDSFGDLELPCWAPIREGLAQKISSVTGGTNVVVDDSDPQNIVISVSGGTTAGTLSEVWFTGDPVTVGAGTFLKAQTGSKGTVESVTQTITVNDNSKAWFPTSFLTNPEDTDNVFQAGEYSGLLSVGASANNVGSQRFTIEIYKTDIDGNVLPSGVTGAPVGSLGVTVVAIGDTGLTTLEANEFEIVLFSGILNDQMQVPAGTRFLFRISGEKVGDAGGAVDLRLFTGTSHSSMLHVPVPVTTSTVLNRSPITGAMLDDVLTALSGTDEYIPSGTTGGGYKARNLFYTVEDLSDWGFEGAGGLCEVLNFRSGMNANNRGYPVYRVKPFQSGADQQEFLFGAEGDRRKRQLITTGNGGAQKQDVTTWSKGTDTSGNQWQEVKYKTWDNTTNFTTTIFRSEWGYNFYRLYRVVASNVEDPTPEIIWDTTVTSDGSIESYAVDTPSTAGENRLGAGKRVVLFADDESIDGGFLYEMWKESAGTRVPAVKVYQRDLNSANDPFIMTLPNTTKEEIDLAPLDTVVIKDWVLTKLAGIDGSAKRYTDSAQLGSSSVTMDASYAGKYLEVFGFTPKAITLTLAPEFPENGFVDFNITDGQTYTVTVINGTQTSVFNTVSGAFRVVKYETNLTSFIRYGSTGGGSVIQSGFFQQNFPLFVADQQMGIIGQNFVAAQRTLLFRMKASVAFSVTKIRMWALIASSSVQVGIYTGGFNSLTRAGYGTLSFSVAGFNEVTLNTAVSLTAGQEYFIAVHWSNSQAGGNQNVGAKSMASALYNPAPASAQATAYYKDAGTDTIPASITSGMTPLGSGGAVPFMELIA